MSEATYRLAGERTTLRPWERADLDALVAIADDADVARYLTPHFPHPYRRKDAQTWIAFNERLSPPLHFAIECDGELAGGIGVTPGDAHRLGTAMAGYWLGTRFWRRGIASDALRTIVPYAFATFRLHRLWAYVNAENTASARVLERAGFEREAVLRAASVARDGSLCDDLVYAIVDPTASVARERDTARTDRRTAS